MSELDLVVQRRNEVEDYEQTVKALLAFAALVVHDGKQLRPASAFGFGRRMRTSAGNLVSPSSEVTPDLVAQKSSAYGLVAEAKKSLPKDQALWASTASQIRKYDDDLSGWWTDSGSIGASDTVLLIHISRSRMFVQYLRAMAERDPAALGPNTCVVEFTGVQEAAFYYLFRLELGTFQNAELQKQLFESLQVPFEKVLQSFPSIHYYDSEPPLEVVLTNLWVDVFPSLLEGTEYDDKTRSRKLRVNVSSLVTEMQAAYGSGALSQDEGSVVFPRAAWVRKALDSFVRYGLAAPIEGVDGEYFIHYRAFRDDVLEKFIRLRETKGEGGPLGGVQVDLFQKRSKPDR